MITVTEIEQTCGACPEQYEGKLSDGRSLYLRYRWGSGRLDIEGETVAEVEGDDPWQGTFNEGDIENLFKQVGIEYSK